jgi:hypothetical protein
MHLDEETFDIVRGLIFVDLCVRQICLCFGSDEIFTLTRSSLACSVHGDLFWLQLFELVKMNVTPTAILEMLKTMKQRKLQEALAES